MKKQYIIAALLTLAGLASVAKAQVVASAQDLIVGFKAASSTTGAATNLEVDLGTISSFFNLPLGTTVNLSSRLSLTDLANTYGADWNTRTDLGWAAAATTTTTGASVLLADGVTTVTDKTVWVTQASSLTTVTNQTVAPVSLYNQVSALSGGNNRVNAMAPLYTGQTGSLNGQIAAGTPFSALVASANGGSWGKQIDIQATTSFNSFNPKIDSASVTNIAPGSYSVVDLFQYQIGSGKGTYVGSLALGADGSLYFTNLGDLTPIPEPSTYAAILGVATLGFAAFRRRKQAAAQAAV